MPAGGGGLEIAPEEIGRSIHLLPLSFDFARVLAALQRAAASPSSRFSTERYSSKFVATEYLKIDSRGFRATGKRSICSESAIH
jgi:hypothetical protein